MARGDMLSENLTANVGVEILNRSDKDAISMTIDFTNVTTTDSQTGEKVVKAGTPIDKDGKPVSETPWDGAIGILLHDSYEHRPQGSILKRAYIHTTRAQSNSGLTYDEALVTALNTKAQCNIIFEEPFIVVS